MKQRVKLKAVFDVLARLVTAIILMVISVWSAHMQIDEDRINEAIN